MTKPCDVFAATRSVAGFPGRATNVRAPLSWLREYVEVDATAHEIARRLNVSALEDRSKGADLANESRQLVKNVAELAAKVASRVESALS